MSVCGCVAKGLVEVVALSNVAGKHDGGGVDPQEACQAGLPQLRGKGYEERWVEVGSDIGVLIWYISLWIEGGKSGGTSAYLCNRNGVLCNGAFQEQPGCGNGGIREGQFLMSRWKWIG